ncbi:hypothetical protein CAPTEDRAFT_200744 [Capitella teleta]|uniref:N-acetyltransferase domain-containing protein n=1 Tax=Capitella teleta TaxID=283909 RepID=R7TIG8_CAPTE|nr:hypothetical protein CAPTEDRAFT_200744 [Capitella teleta]|eukprot:ELT91311.1 hypothetical protein CAPTEDRAFT_200744 [Capitella teleta]
MSLIYKEYDDGFVVRRMRPHETTYIQQWDSDLVPTGRDLDVAINSYSADSDGFYIGEYRGEVVASVIRIPLAEDVFYGSCFYVVEKFRGSGFGRRIRDDVAAGFVGSKTLCVDAHDFLEEMNKKRGYISGYNVVMYKGKPPRKSTALPAGTTLKNALDVSFDKIIDYDNKCFVRPNSPYRYKILKQWIRMEGGKSVVALSTSGDVIALACRRPSVEGRHHIIGPLYAGNILMAQVLVEELCEDLETSSQGDMIWLNMRESSERVKQLVRLLDLEGDLRMLRMYLNGDLGDLNHDVFAVTSVDFCGY